MMDAIAGAAVEGSRLPGSADPARTDTCTVLVTAMGGIVGQGVLKCLEGSRYRVVGVDASEYAAGHILGAKNVPLARIEEGANDLARRKEKPLVVYCDTGNRASKALGALKKQDFARVVNLSGGLGAWQQAGLPVEK